MKRLLGLTIAIFFISCENQEKRLFADGGQWNLAYIKHDSKIIPGAVRYDFDADGTFKMFTGDLIIPGTFRTSKDSIWLEPKIKGEPTVAKYYFEDDKLKLDLHSRNALSWELHKIKTE